jgi:hypothetical protein
MHAASAVLTHPSSCAVATAVYHSWHHRHTKVANLEPNIRDLAHTPVMALGPDLRWIHRMALAVL